MIAKYMTPFGLSPSTGLRTGSVEALTPFDRLRANGVGWSRITKTQEFITS